MPSVRLVNLTKRYGEIVAVKNINLHVYDGEYVCVIGPSGCGKTTLIKCIAGIIEPTEGEVYIGDRMVNGVPIEKRGIGYVFQEIALFPHMNVYENISYGPTVKGWEVARSERLIEEMIHMMALHERVRDYPDELSGGAQQKTAIARALSSGSTLLLLDEPLGALDAKVRSVLRRELRRMVKDLGLTALHVTHDQEEAMAIADRIVVMKAGRIIEVGTPMELYLHPKRLFTANFVGEANFMVGKILEVTGRGTWLSVNNERIYTSSRVSNVLVGEKVVVAIRPEFVVMRRYEGRRSIMWLGKVENKMFMGSSVRYEVKMDNGLMISVKKPFSLEAFQIDVGDRVNLIFPPEYVLLYHYPKEGLEKEISIE
ncbi:ABC transporter ATP-binding protein [Candidatus Bathyarchaeota archaeon]|nr:MAG: ABC transporter ATP-binding protein [Candidatus Bathyarchaeota archaeon]